MKPEKIFEIVQREMYSIGNDWSRDFNDFDRSALRYRLDGLACFIDKALFSSVDIDYTEDKTQKENMLEDRMTDNEKEVFKIANNVLWFDDNSDYASALWEILSTLKPGLFKNTDMPDLEYIED